MSRTMALATGIAPAGGARVPLDERVDLERLSALAAAFGAAERLEDVLRVAASHLPGLFPDTTIAVSRFEAEDRRLRTLLNAGVLVGGDEPFPADETYEQADWPLLMGELRAGRIILARRDDPGSEPSLLAFLHTHDLGSGAAVPVVVTGRAWGELFVGTGLGAPALDEHDVFVLRLVSDHLALALGRAELLERLTALAYADTLTGLPNRRVLEERLERDFDHARQDGVPLSVLLCDLDDLKALNDGRGHDSGDDALRAVADALRAAAREHPDALACRLGGDEFCLLLPGLDAPEAHRIGDRLRRELAQGDDPRSISGGVASTRLFVGRPTDLLRAADIALYAAKRGGRGLICVADRGSQEAWAYSGLTRRRRPRDRDQPVGGGPVFEPLLAEAFELLDGPLAAAGPAERLTQVVSAFTRAVDGAALAVSTVRDGSVAAHFQLDRRSGHSSGTAVSAPDEDVYRLEDFPATAAVLAGTGASVWLRADDPDTDPAERALLARWSLDGVLMVGAHAPSGSWLVEVFADAATLELERFGPALRALCAAALVLPRTAG